jgi:PhnB protein
MPVPSGYHSVTPYLMVRGAAKAIDFYGRAFGAEEIMRLESDGKVGHAEVRIGDSVVMLADEHPELGFVGPESLGGTSGSILLYVDDVDDAFRRAIDAGATEVREVQDQFFGDRSGTLKDPFGHLWTLSTRIEEVSPEEMQRRYQAMMKQD